MKNLANLLRILVCIFFNLSIIFMNKDFQRKRCESIRVTVGVSGSLNASMVIGMNFLPVLYLVAPMHGTKLSLCGK